jgi:predicted dehydrogenase
LFLRRRIPEQGPLKAAVIGAGAFGRHHAAKYTAAEGVELFAIADLNPDIRRTMTAQYGVLAVADWRELLGRVDLVSICSPAVTHATIVEAFLKAGAHVLVEKPIATTLHEADALIELAARMNKVLTVGHQERFVFARTGLLDHGEAPLEIECWRKGPWTGRGADVSVVLDLMIHDLDLVHRLVHEPVEEVEASGIIEKSQSADEVSATVRFENGTVARFETSRISDVRSRGMRAVYADGVIEIDFITRTVTNTTPRPLNELEMGDPLGESVRAFIAAARSGAAATVRPEEARRALETALLIDRAATPAVTVFPEREIRAAVG